MSDETQSSPPELLTGVEAVERAERILCDDAVTRHPATAEGLALAGCRSASVSTIQATALGGGSPGLPQSCVHHFVGGHVPWEPGRSAFELADADAQTAVDHCLVAHLLSAQLGRPGTCSLSRSAATALAQVQLLDITAELDAGPDLVRDPDADGDHVASLAHAVFRDVSVRTGRSLDVTARSGPAEAPRVLVVAGSPSSAARAAAEALTADGDPTAVVQVALIHPCPEERLRADLVGARIVAVIEDPVHPDWLESLHAVLPNGATSVRIRVPDGVSASHLLSKLETPFGIEAPTASGAGDASQLVVLSDRAWARSVARHFASQAGLPAGRTGDLELISWGVSFTLRGLDPGHRVLVAARPDGASIQATIARLGGSVMVVSDTGALELLHTLGDACRAALDEADVRLFQLPDGAPDEIATAVLAALRDGAGQVSQALLKTPLPPEEVDFGAETADGRPTLPSPADLPEHSSEALRSFHRGGARPFGGPDPGIRVAAIDPLVAAIRPRGDDDHEAGFVERGAVLPLCLESLASVSEPARTRFAEEVARLAEGLDDLLLLEHLQSDEGRAAGAIRTALGGAAGLLDVDRLATAVGGGVRGSTRLPDARRARIETTRNTLAAWLTVADDLADNAVLVPAGAGLDIPLPPQGWSEHPEPMTAAVGLFDGLARRVLPVVRAARTAALELRGEYLSGVHDEALGRLDWAGLLPDELALIPPVTAVVPGNLVRDGGEGELAGLIRSGRPVGVLILDEANPEVDALEATTVHESIGWLSVGHREGLVLQTTVARPEHLRTALGRLAEATRPCVVVISTEPAAAGDLAAIRAEADLIGRSSPVMVYDPDTGESWAERFSLAGNPQVDARWPKLELACRDEAGADATIDITFTHAHALALQPGFAEQFQVIPTSGWAQDQVSVAEYIAGLVPGEAQAAIPYLWVIDSDGVLGRAITTRDVILAARDRGRAWRLLQELAGYDNLHALRAAEAARIDAQEAADEAAQGLAKAHDAALDEARADTARESMERLAAALMDLDTPLTGSAKAAPTPPLPAPEAAPDNGAAGPAVATPAEEVEAPPPALIGADPWLDTPMCTSCNECTNLNGRMFQYDGDKQAFLADASAGTFAELVKAAELCPADCIHPGKPRTDDSSATPQVLERAAALG